MLRVYTQFDHGNQWLGTYQGRRPLLACVLGFTDTGLVPHISTAGATPAARRLTALADAEFLFHGPQAKPQYPLPYLVQGVSPVFISWPIYSHQQFPLQIFNAGLNHQPPVPTVDLGGQSARCISSGAALPLHTVEWLFQQGRNWGESLARQREEGYLILAECVVGGTTTAQAILTGFGYQVAGQVNSSHPVCNHDQKRQWVERGLAKANQQPPNWLAHPLALVAAVGDPMQVVVAGMMIAASRYCGVMLAGGTQMLAVYALARQIARTRYLAWQPDNIIVGTTRWVVEDPSGDTVALANQVGEVPLVATQLSFSASRFSQLRAFEQGFVKEGVGAGGCAIAAHLYQGWQQQDILRAVEQTLETYRRLREQAYP
ncbi:nicotinate mononucleotide-dependent phosphoribosyltransferase CobT [Acaryochloris sp. IP29b_bin.137]|uniref:nicotinate mononucleotide-dependent phosphoribosyltransferase CobT n=1 Tax=Acaryochloris sp. IP29b_bin.137 TaxID=2969217 RepID=UPI00260EC8C9|nr:TIGR00303 family protein [Acaryochloris sp. IP29b_bin.137]